MWQIIYITCMCNIYTLFMQTRRSQFFKYLCCLQVNKPSLLNFRITSKNKRYSLQNKSLSILNEFIAPENVSFQYYKMFLCRVGIQMMRSVAVE